ncbi:MAG: methyltransferase [Myxococcales bacterium]|nr:methyltransferase [Myxococcales bacterium]
MPRNRAGSPTIDGLDPDDPGIGLLSRAIRGVPAREILLVCCGDVPGVGGGATRLILDVRERVGARARVVPVTAPWPEAQRFGHALVWPRAHLGKDFTLDCLARGALALRPGGTLWCAVRRAKGAESLADEIGAMMGEVDVAERSRGYRLLCARRGEAFDEARARARLEVDLVIEDAALPGLSLRSAPGVFSRRALDAGTRALLEHAEALTLEPGRVLDLGCGVGPLALWAARRWPQAQVLAVDSNLRAVALAMDNAARHGLGDRVRVVASDGMPTPPDEGLADWRGAIELALVNPPTHADPQTSARLARDLRDWLGPEAVALLVVSRPGRMTQALTETGARVQGHTGSRYTVLEARWGAGG